MKNRPLKSKTLTALSPAAAATRAADRHESAFGEVVQMIEAARARAYHAVNTELIDLYWRVGEYVSRKIANAG